MYRNIPEWDKVWSRLSSHLQPFFFWLIAPILTIFDKKYRILTNRVYGSLWPPLWLSLALTATLWHTLALSGSLLLSNFAYTVLDRLSGPLLGSQRCCHADALSPALFRVYSFGLWLLLLLVSKSKPWKNIYWLMFFWLSLLCAAGQPYNIASDYIRIMWPLQTII